jgi:regulator of sirC expression with transglutaminase-like and TPR domain
MDFLEDFAADREFLKLLGRQESEVDLLRLALELARDAYPELAFDGVLRWVDDRALELQEPLASAKSDAEVLEALRCCLAERHGIQGRPESFHHPDGSYLNRVIELRTGLPIALSVLYMAVGQRAGVSLQGVAAPEHFLTRYETLDKPIFVDAFRGGRAIPWRRCVRQMQDQFGLSRKRAREVLEPVGPRPIIIRMLNNLKVLFAREGNWRSCFQVQHRLLALQPAAYVERRDWAITALRANRAGAAIDMLEACLATCPENERQLLRDQLEAAKNRVALLN